MANRKKVVLDDEQESQLKAHIAQAHNAADDSKTEFMPQYQKSWMYRLGLLPAKNSWTDNGYVEQVVEEACAGIEPSIRKICTEGRMPAMFRSYGYNNIPDQDEAINNTIERFFMRENNGKVFIEESITEAMTTEGCYARWYIEDEKEEQSVFTEDYVPVSFILSKLGEGWMPVLPRSVDEKKSRKRKGAYKGMEWKKGKITTGVQQDPNTGNEVQTTATDILVKGKSTFRKITPKFHIERVEYNDLWWDTSHGSDIRKADYVGIKQQKTVAELIDMGFDKEIIEESGTANNLGENPMDKRDLGVNYQNPTFVYDNGEPNTYADPMARKVDYWERYIYTSLHTNGKKFELVQVKMTDFEILEVNPIKSMPFAHGQVIPIPGSAFGRSMFTLFQPLQDIISRIKRTIADAADMSTYGRYEAKKGGYDRQSMLNNRPGAVIEVMEMGNVVRFPEKGLDPSVVEALSQFSDARDRLLSGAAGAINTANGAPELAAATAAMMIDNEMMKDKVIAGNFIHTFIIPIMEGILETMIAEKYVITNSDGSTITADMIPDRYGFDIDVNTSNDTVIRNQQLMQTITQLANIGQITGTQIIGANTQIASGAEVLRSLAFTPEKYLHDPSKEVDPVEQAHQQQMKAIELAGAKRDLDLKKAQSMESAARQTLYLAQAEEAHKDGESKRQERLDNTLVKFKQAATGQFKADTDKQKADDNHAVSVFEMKTAAVGAPSNITGLN